jgi:hypothetical protein
VPGCVGALLLSFGPSPDPEKPTVNGTNPPRSGADHDSTYLAASSRATATYRDLACWLLEKETVVEADPPGVSAAAERACQKLSEHLSKWVSPVGSHAILSSALNRARAEFPFLEGVHAGTALEACLEGLREQLHDVEAGEASKGVLAVVAALLDLVVGFIGEDLSLRLVREVWPDLPLGGPPRPRNSDGQEDSS